MPSPRFLLAAGLLLALAACEDTATAPTDRELLGTWSIVPTANALAGSDLRQMTVRFGPDGGYAVQTSTYGGGPADHAVRSFGSSAGSVSAQDGELRFHPSTAFSIGRRSPSSGSLLDPDALDPDHPFTYEVVGNRLVLHLPPLASPGRTLVLTRAGQ
jgi:hypothetical protein